MRNLLAGVLGLLLAGGILANGAGLAGAQGLTGAGSVLGAVEGGVAPAVALAGQGLVLPPTIEDVEEMCALLLGCPGIPLSPPKTDFGECVRTVWASMSQPDAVKFSIPLRECGLQSDSCKELRECALRGAAPDGCKGRGKDKAVGFCDNDGRAVTCYKEKIVQVRDCPRYGEQCAAREGQSTCILGACPADVPSDGTPVCSANGLKIFQCDQGKLVSLDCTAFGLACVKDPDGKPTCAAASTPACTKGLARCDGDDHAGCVGGHEVKVQCGKAGMKCTTAPDATTNGVCTAPPIDGGTCTPGPAKCNGNNIDYCVAGKQRSFFCKGLGFSKCNSKNGQVSCGN
jgi:hypothetical protein